MNRCRPGSMLTFHLAVYRDLTPHKHTHTRARKQALEAADTFWSVQNALSKTIAFAWVAFLCVALRHTS